MNIFSQEQIIERLQAHGIYPTQQRIELAEIMLSRDQHLSAEQVMQRVQHSQTKVSKATIYNTLGLFAEKGLLREVIVDPTRVFYDSNIGQHHHFFNVDTGTLSDIDAAELSIGDLPVLPDGTEVDGVDVIVRIRNQTA
ncbi:Fur family transcriptional regulator [Sulfuriflexus mobilis]|uniref:Fur family transcriptional regulator n=1 Tax=Sulfuriflexus mobilis TaxID=1811807 RepID=UPI000F82587A|nr:transcriptional repressor [Sulfuriflexus mobilis]